MKTFLVALWYVAVACTMCFADDLDRHARATMIAPPIYPADEKQAGREGTASIVLKIDANGVATIERAMGTRQAFIDAVKTTAGGWAFAPGRRDGRRVPETLEYIVVFNAQKGVEILGPLYRE